MHNQSIRGHRRGPALLARLFGLVVAGVLVSAHAEENLPRQMTWSAYGTTSTGYVQAIAVSNTLRKFYGTSVRVIPGKNDISRIMPLARKRADLCACGVSELYFAQEGLTLFAVPTWGPQQMRILFTNRGDGIGHSLVMAGDAGIESLADLKGKRVAWVRGSPALQHNTTGILAFAGLTWDDVVRVDVPGYRQGLDALLNNSVDATWASTTASHVQRIAASPRGLLWPAFPPEDEAAWQRLWQYAPHLGKTMVKHGAGLEHNMTGKVPYPGLGASYPAYVSYADMTDEVAYAITKAVIGNYKDFENAAPSMESYAPDRQDFRLVLPYHPGAIRYFREIGIWGDEDDTYNEGLLERQRLLADAWKEAGELGLDGDEFTAAWMELREQRLNDAGMATNRPTAGTRPSGG
jgi:TRAP transporter TAXI family solute receptor